MSTFADGTSTSYHSIVFGLEANDESSRASHIRARGFGLDQRNSSVLIQGAACDDVVERILLRRPRMPKTGIPARCRKSCYLAGQATKADDAFAPRCSELLGAPRDTARLKYDPL
jgi:hypothetical protein